MPENTFATNSFYEVLSTKYSEFLKRDEVYEIIIQFRRLPLWPGHQVMWSGVPRDWVQSWADERGMQTLSSALGPLMDGKSRVCRRRHKTTEEWSLYVAGASALFAECLPKGHVVTLVTRPPPQRLHPLGSTTYQLLELPALKRDIYGLSASRIDVVHITVRGAENYAYQFWPIDEKHHWIESFSYCLIRKHLGRKSVRLSSSKRR
ncbi:hypothetical protein DOTSEDRAFT_45490 [Dothistroma septosporum NZE10]|uniref:Uncharacterized protein n=1 Tax=Dothistroma septosporum (strain NZE10 / CBS 128990) TaxID=675120 RepID=M2XMD8_DOTSN|nr:hypothetical protein DOTSEDRAFT_45490 [Dothistroma septosporum NZE10]